MDLSKLLDVTDVGPSDSFLSKNTSILKSLSSIDPSSSTLTSTSFYQNNNEDNLKQLINQVTKQDLLLNIIKKCVEENSKAKIPEETVITNGKGSKNVNIKNNVNKFSKTNVSKSEKEKTNDQKCANTIPTLDPELKTKIKHIIKFNSLKNTFEENNLAEVLAFSDKDFDVSQDGNEMKLNQQEADQLNDVVEKCIDQMYTHTILEKRHSSTQSSIDRLQALQSKIQAKYSAIESLLTSIGQVQSEMVRLSTEEYQKTVIQDSTNIALMTANHVNKLHAQVVLTLGTEQGNPTQTPHDLNQSIIGLDDSISSLEFSIGTVKLEIADLEERLHRHKRLESNPGSAAVYKTLRKLQNTIKHKQFILKQLSGSG